MLNTVVNVNGEILDAEKATISVFDRGFIYGDSLYEVCRTYAGKLHELDNHLARLSKSADLAYMTLGQPLEEYARQMERAVEAFFTRFGKDGHQEAYCRLIVTRGVGKIGFGLKNLLTPTQYVIIVQPLDWFTGTGKAIEQGIALKVATRIRNDRRALDPAMKSGNYLNNLLAYLEAGAEDFADALLCNAEGHVTEGTTFNIFYVRRGIAATPPLGVGILDGITRREMIQLLHEMGIPVREVLFTKERLYEADEVFATSTLKGAFPVIRVDSRKIGSGKPGPVTMKLRKAYAAYVEEKTERLREAHQEAAAK